MEEVKNYADLLPQRPPEGIYQRLKEKPELEFNRKYLIYRSSKPKKTVTLHCTACGGEMEAKYIAGPSCAGYAPAPFGFRYPIGGECGDAVMDGNATMCPICGAVVKARHIGNLRYPKQDTAWVMTVHRLEQEIALVGWRIYQETSKDGRVGYGYNRYEAYVTASATKMVRLKGYLKCMSSISYFNGWEQMKKFRDQYGAADMIYPFDPHILDGSNVENCKLDLLVNHAMPNDREIYPASYLRLFQKHPQVENLLMTGAWDFLTSAMQEELRRYSYEPAPSMVRLDMLDWKKKRPAQMLGLDREEYRACVKGKWSSRNLSCYQYVKKIEPAVRAEDMKMLKRWTIHSCKDIVEQEMPMLKSLRYLEKQYAKLQKKDKPRFACSTLTDYWRMAKKLGCDMTQEVVQYPPHLLAAHDRMAVLQKFDAVKQHTEKFAARYKKLKKFAWEADGLCIFPPKAPDELVNEGNVLSHCVGGYCEGHAKGSHTIFFIRKADDPERPFFTLELNPKNLTVVQNRGYRNCARTPEVEAFERKWLDHIRQLKTKKKEEAAA